MFLAVAAPISTRFLSFINEKYICEAADPDSNVSVRFFNFYWQENRTGRPGLLLERCWRHTCSYGRSWDRWTLLYLEETQWMSEGEGELEERNTLGFRFQQQDPPVPRHVEERGLQPCKDQQVSSSVRGLRLHLLLLFDVSCLHMFCVPWPHPGLFYVTGAA